MCLNTERPIHLRQGLCIGNLQKEQVFRETLKLIWWRRHNWMTAGLVYSIRLQKCFKLIKQCSTSSLRKLKRGFVQVLISFFCTAHWLYIVIDWDRIIFSIVSLSKQLTKAALSTKSSLHSSSAISLTCSHSCETLATSFWMRFLLPYLLNYKSYLPMNTETSFIFSIACSI